MVTNKMTPSICECGNHNSVFSWLLNIKHNNLINVKCFYYISENNERFYHIVKEQIYFHNGVDGYIHFSAYESNENLQIIKSLQKLKIKNIDMNQPNELIIKDMKRIYDNLIFI